MARQKEDLVNRPRGSVLHQMLGKKGKQMLGLDKLICLQPLYFQPSVLGSICVAFGLVLVVASS